MKLAKTENIDYGFWGAVIFALLIGWGMGQSMEQKSFTPRSFENSDTIYTDDSIYKVKFKIDSVWKNNEKEYEPAERN